MSVGGEKKLLPGNLVSLVVAIEDEGGDVPLEYWRLFHSRK